MFLLALASVIRLLTGTGLDHKIGQAAVRTASTREFVSFLSYLELGRVGAWSESDDQPDGAQARAQSGTKETQTSPDKAASGQTETQAQAETEETQTQAAPDKTASGQTETQTQTATPQEPSGPLTFTAEDAAGIKIGGACTYTVDKAALLLQPSVLDFSGDGPKVLIVHTHTSEAYTQETGWEYAVSDTMRTEDPDYSVVRVGTEITDVLQSHGISVIHDTSFNDYPSYNGCYARTLEKIENWLSLYPSIQMVIDVHRDAASDENGNPIGSVVTVDGQESAQIMLVMGTDEGGLEHPDWRDNLSWALKLQAVLNREYPTLCRNIDLRTERFNEHTTHGSMLVEVGSTGNTLKQAITAGHAFGEGLAKLIGGSQ